MALRLSSLALVALVAIASLGPLAQKAKSGEVVASWYGSELEGSPTASGEPFHAAGFTAASKTLPLGTKLTVCKDSCVQVRVNDRGPYIAGRDLDLSEGAAKSIGLDGVEEVQVAEEPGPKAPVGKLPSTGGAKLGRPGPQ